MFKFYHKNSLSSKEVLKICYRNMSFAYVLLLKQKTPIRRATEPLP